MSMCLRRKETDLRDSPHGASIHWARWTKIAGAMVSTRDVAAGIQHKEEDTDQSRSEGGDDVPWQGQPAMRPVRQIDEEPAHGANYGNAYDRQRGEKEKTMPEVTVHPADRPSWVDLASPNVSASTQFYGQLFGWEAKPVGGPEVGNYTFFMLRGKDIAGVGSQMDDRQPPAWTLYFASDNVDQTQEKIQAAGGNVLMGAMDVMGAGRMGIYSDPTGAAFGIWQAGAHKGASIMNEPGAYTWGELQTRDIPAAKGFYQQAFGWSETTNPMGPGQPDYTEWKQGGESIGGAMAMMAAIPAEVPAHWLVYFQVESADRSAEKAVQLGGRILKEPMDFPGGRFAVVSDPQGAGFGILEMRAR